MSGLTARHRAFVALQYLLPQHAVSRFVYWLTRRRSPWIRNALIRAFVGHYRPALDEAAQPQPLQYASFNAFFTRALRAGVRPLDPDPARVLSPADGRLSAAGIARTDTLLQAKGHDFTLPALLADPAFAAGGAEANTFRDGLYATIYLAPSNYHRVHMPLDGTLRAAWHVPGRLFSVNDVTAQLVPRLFARNERVVCLFDSRHGPFAVVLVGALCVGSMATVWHREITPRRARGMTRLTPVTSAAAAQPRGAELGRFNMGSTVILLLPRAMADWDVTLAAGQPLRMGMGLGTLRAAPDAGIGASA